MAHCTCVSTTISITTTMTIVASTHRTDILDNMHGMIRHNSMIRHKLKRSMETLLVCESVRALRIMRS